MRGTMMLLVLTMLAGASSAAGAMDIESLTIVTKGGGAHLFQVEVARTNEERSQGLMFREKLEPDKGMLFEFRQPQLATMWMKNTVISLDMLFIRKNGE
ncbi:MAG: DUF192 domain-containing protein, partial [Methylobacteriaceae bacterium]|nr:DUF192 domain-containing protein [Methylobacteriaceae bacterium]